MTQRSKAPIVIGVVVVVLLIGVPLVAWLLRGVIATSIARSQLEERGIACDSRFSVSPSATLGEATVGPTRRICSTPPWAPPATCATVD